MKLDLGKITETRFFGFICHLTYAPATLRRRLKNLVSVGSPPPFSAFAKLQSEEEMQGYPKCISGIVTNQSATRVIRDDADGLKVVTIQARS
jgi:hypothetical protein